MPVRVSVGRQPFQLLRPTAEWQTTPLPAGAPREVRVDDGFYVVARDVNAPPPAAGAAPRAP
jgi:hypothetical protein